MAKKISQLTSAGALTGTEPVAIVQGGATKKTTVQDIADLNPGGSQDLQSVLDQGGAALLTGDVTVTDDQTHTVAFGTNTGTAIGNFLVAAENAHIVGITDVFLNVGGGTGFQMDLTQMVFTDNDNSKGPGDAADYSANKTDFSYATRKMLLDTVAGLKWKASTRVSTTIAGTLATDFENGDTVDGVVLATGNRILIKNQATQSENGIYTVNASGAPTRSTDADLAAELEGATVTVQEGTSNSNTTWTQTTDGITLGSSNIVWAQFGTSVPDASETVKGIIEIATQAETTTGTDDVRAVTPLKLAVATRGVQDLFISAAGMWPRTTGGCAELAKGEMATSLFNIQSLDFDQTTQEFAQFQIVLPRKWNNGTVTAVFYWTATTGSGDVQWGISGGAYSNDDALTVAFGTAITVDDTLLATNDLHITSATAAITLAGTPASADFLAFQISRNPGSDTLTGDAKLLGVSIRLTTTSAIDA